MGFVLISINYQLVQAGPAPAAIEDSRADGNTGRKDQGIPAGNRRGEVTFILGLMPLARAT